MIEKLNVKRNSLRYKSRVIDRWAVYRTAALAYVCQIGLDCEIASYMFLGPGLLRNVHAKSMITDQTFQTWHLTDWQHSCQPIIGFVRKSLLIIMDFDMNFTKNPGPSWLKIERDTF